MRGLKLYVRRSALPEPGEDEFYVADLIGMAVVSPDGEPLGQVKDARDFGAGDLLEIQPPQGESWWLPFTKDAVPEVRVAERTVVAVRPEEVE